MRKLIVLGLLAALATLAAPTAIPAGGKAAGPNGRIAFARDDPASTDGETFTYTANPDGSDVQPLFPGFHAGFPRWSPDGSEVAILAPCTDGEENCAVTIVNPDTGTFRQLKMPDPTLFIACLAWSPYATHFACEGGNDDSSANGVYTIRSSDGGGLTRLTNAGGGSDIPIDYSPDGTQIVFGRFDVPNRPPRANSALFVLNLNGGAVRRITPWGFADNAGSWSPDGTKIAFEHLGSLFVVDPDGTGLAKIPLEINGRSGAGDFAWSPDGNKIAFLLFSRTGQGIATANADGSDVQPDVRSHGGLGVASADPLTHPHQRGQRKRRESPRRGLSLRSHELDELLPRDALLCVA
jgi:Tol biopolymer transport system component